jgi:hypothetical protein
MIALDRREGSTTIPDLMQALVDLAESRPVVTVNGDGEITQIDWQGAMMYRVAKPTAPFLRKTIEGMVAVQAQLMEIITTDHGHPREGATYWELIKRSCPEAYALLKAQDALDKT